MHSRCSSPKREPPKVICVDTETDIDANAPTKVDPLRSTLVAISIALAPGEAYYFPLRHGMPTETQGELLDPERVNEQDEAGKDEQYISVVQNLPPIMSPELKPLRDLLEDASVHKTAHNAKYDILVLRRAGITLRGLDFDTMVASYVIDPGRRSHALDVLALELLDYQMTAYEDICGKGKAQIPYSHVPIEIARDYSCEDVGYHLTPTRIVRTPVRCARS